MGKTLVFGILLAAGCGATYVSNLQALQSGDLAIGEAQQQCLNGAANRFSVLTTWKAIPDQYVVVMYPDTTQETARDLAARYQGTVLYAPAGAVDAFGVRMDEPHARQLATAAGVCEVYQDFYVLR
jgi:hypothetical protein